MTEYADLFNERYSTSLLADSAYRTGIKIGIPAPGLGTLDRNAKMAGPAVTVTANSDLVSILEVVHRANPGDVVVISNPTVPAGLMGDLIGTEAVRKGLAGFVVDGLVRDSMELVSLGLPVFCRGTYPAGPLKLPVELKGVGVVGGEVAIGGEKVSPGMWVFGDADGLVLLAEAGLDDVFAAAETASRQEEALAAEIQGGVPLGEAFELEAFLTKRQTNPEASFNAHLRDIDRAI